MKVLALLSGGIDSPVAAWMMERQGYDVDFLFFYASPYMREINKITAEKMAEKLDKINKKKSRFFTVDYGKALAEIAKNCPANLRCILCRRMMFRIANKIAKENGYEALLTGENLAQVASQTLQNMVLGHKVSTIPVLTPLLCSDKVDTMATAEKIGTLEISKEHRCCGMVPDNPRTKGREDEIAEAEKNLDIEKITEESYYSGS